MISPNGRLPATLAHYMPGRVRLKLDPEYRNNEFVDELSQMLGSVPGILGLQARLSTGSVVVRYDPSVLDTGALIELGRTANLIAADGGGEPWPVRREVRPQASPSANVNWNTMVPLALVIWSLKGILVDGRRPPAPWYALLWYAYSIYAGGRRSAARRTADLELAGETVQTLAAIEGVD